MLSRTLCPVLVGRDEELSALEGALNAARRAQGQVVLVAGDAGIGKTRLVSELARKAETAGLPVLWGGFSETDLQVPYLPFVEAIRNHLRRQPEMAASRDLDGLFGGPVGEAVDPSQRRIQIMEAVLRFLEDAASGGGAVLILEDLHWSDSGTRDLLDYAARSLRGTQLLVIATYRADEVNRGHPLRPLVRGWVQRDLATVIDLRPLSQAEVAAMLRATLGEHDAALAARLHQRCEGNPFVLEELLKTGAGDLGEQALPATVRDAILSRVEKLDKPHVDVLRAAAVLGEPIDDGILVDLFGDQVPEALEECTRQQLLTPLPDGVYAWRHALTREAVYEEMAPARRRRLHSQLADLCDGRSGFNEVAVCHHLAAAGRWGSAVPRCRQAAETATSVGAFADAARLLELCLPHIDERSAKTAIMEELPELLMQSGWPERGEAFARQALVLRDEQGDPVLTAAARRTLALCLWQQARWAEAIVLEDQSIAELEPFGPSPALVAALARRASWNMLAEGEMPAAVQLVQRARCLAEKHGLDPDLYRSDEGQVLMAAGQVDEGLTLLDEGWRARLRHPVGRGSSWREAKFMLHHAVALRNLLGRTTESLAILGEAPISKAPQDAADVSLAVVEIEALWAHGRVAMARQLAASLDLARIERNIVPWAQSVRADLALSSGATTDAAALARTAMPPHWQPASQLRAGGLVRVLVSAGDLTGALELTPRLERLGGYGIEMRLPFLDAAIEAHLTAGQTVEAARLAAKADGARPDHPLHMRIEARMLMAGGADAHALERLRAAAAGFVGTGHRQDEWHTRRLIARVLQNLGERRQAQAELNQIDQEMAAANGEDAPSTQSRLEQILSPREREVVLLVAQGLRNRQIAARLFISERTVENHIHRALERTGLRTRAELAVHIMTLSTGLSGSPE